MEDGGYKNKITEIPEGLKRDKILQNIGFRTEKNIRNREKSQRILGEIELSMGDLSKLPKTDPEEQKLIENLLDKCDEAIDLDSRNADLYLYKAMILADLASIDDDWFNLNPLIDDCMKKYFQLVDDMVFSYYVSGYWQYKKENYRSAISAYQRYLKNMEDDPPRYKVDVFFEIGYCYYMMGDYFSAMSHLLKFQKYMILENDPRAEVASDLISIIKRQEIV